MESISNIPVENPFRLQSTATTAIFSKTLPGTTSLGRQQPSLQPSSSSSSRLLQWFQAAEQLLLNLEESSYDNDDAVSTVAQLREMDYPMLLEQMRTAWCRTKTPDDRLDCEARYYQASIMTLVAHLLEVHTQNISRDHFVASDAVQSLVAVCSDVCTVKRLECDDNQDAMVHPCPMFELCWGCHGSKHDDIKSFEDILHLGTILPQRVHRAQKQHAKALQKQLYHDRPVGRPCRPPAKEYDLTWGVLLVYLMGRWSCWQNYNKRQYHHRGGDVVLSWVDDVERMVTLLFRGESNLPPHERDDHDGAAAFVEFFPRILPEQTLAGLAMLQLDILANEGKMQWTCNDKSVVAVSIHQISPWNIARKYLMQNEFSGVVSLLQQCTGLPRYQLLARCAEVIEGSAPILTDSFYIGHVTMDDVVAASNEIMKECSPRTYLNLLKENGSRQRKNERSHGVSAPTATRTGTWRIQKHLLAPAYPLLAHIKILLLRDDVKGATSTILSEMEKIHVSLGLFSNDDLEQGWLQFMMYLECKGDLFLDSNGKSSLAYSKRVALFKSAFIFSTGRLGFDIIMGHYSNLIDSVRKLPNGTFEERDYITLASQHTMLQLLMEKFNVRDGIQRMLKLFPDLWQGQEPMKWAIGFLHQENPIPSRLLLSDLDGPRVIVTPLFPKQDRVRIAVAATPAASFPSALDILAASAYGEEEEVEVENVRIVETKKSLLENQVEPMNVDEEFSDEADDRNDNDDEEDVIEVLDDEPGEEVGGDQTEAYPPEVAQYSEDDFKEEEIEEGEEAVEMAGFEVADDLHNDTGYDREEDDDDEGAPVERLEQASEAASSDSQNFLGKEGGRESEKDFEGEDDEEVEILGSAASSEDRGDSNLADGEEQINNYDNQDDQVEVPEEEDADDEEQIWPPRASHSHSVVEIHDSDSSSEKSVEREGDVRRELEDDSADEQAELDRQDDDDSSDEGQYVEAQVLDDSDDDDDVKLDEDTTLKVRSKNRASESIYFPPLGEDGYEPDTHGTEEEASVEIPTEEEAEEDERREERPHIHNHPQSIMRVEQRFQLPSQYSDDMDEADEHTGTEQEDVGMESSEENFDGSKRVASPFEAATPGDRQTLHDYAMSAQRGLPRFSAEAVSQELQLVQNVVNQVPEKASVLDDDNTSMAVASADGGDFSEQFSEGKAEADESLLVANAIVGSSKQEATDALNPQDDEDDDDSYEQVDDTVDRALPAYARSESIRVLVGSPPRDLESETDEVEPQVDHFSGEPLTSGAKQAQLEERQKDQRDLSARDVGAVGTDPHVKEDDLSDIEAVVDQIPSDIVADESAGFAREALSRSFPAQGGRPQLTRMDSTMAQAELSSRGDFESENEVLDDDSSPGQLGQSQRLGVEASKGILARPRLSRLESGLAQAGFSSDEGSVESDGTEIIASDNVVDYVPSGSLEVSQAADADAARSAEGKDEKNGMVTVAVSQEQRGSNENAVDQERGLLGEMERDFQERSDRILMLGGQSLHPSEQSIEVDTSAKEQGMQADYQNIIPTFASPGVDSVVQATVAEKSTLQQTERGQAVGALLETGVVVQQEPAEFGFARANKASEIGRHQIEVKQGESNKPKLPLQNIDTRGHAQSTSALEQSSSAVELHPHEETEEPTSLPKLERDVAALETPSNGDVEESEKVATNRIDERPEIIIGIENDERSEYVEQRISDEIVTSQRLPSLCGEEVAEGLEESGKELPAAHGKNQENDVGEEELEEQTFAAAPEVFCVGLEPQSKPLAGQRNLEFSSPVADIAAVNATPTDRSLQLVPLLAHDTISETEPPGDASATDKPSEAEPPVDESVSSGVLDDCAIEEPLFSASSPLVLPAAIDELPKAEQLDSPPVGQSVALDELRIAPNDPAEAEPPVEESLLAPDERSEAQLPVEESPLVPFIAPDAQLPVDESSLVPHIAPDGPSEAKPRVDQSSLAAPAELDEPSIVERVRDDSPRLVQSVALDEPSKAARVSDNPLFVPSIAPVESSEAEPPLEESPLVRCIADKSSKVELLLDDSALLVPPAALGEPAKAEPLTDDYPQVKIVARDEPPKEEQVSDSSPFLAQSGARDEPPKTDPSVDDSPLLVTPAALEEPTKAAFPVDDSPLLVPRAALVEAANAKPLSDDYPLSAQSGAPDKPQKGELCDGDSPLHGPPGSSVEPSKEESLIENSPYVLSASRDEPSQGESLMNDSPLGLSVAPDEPSALLSQSVAAYEPSQAEPQLDPLVAPNEPLQAKRLIEDSRRGDSVAPNEPSNVQLLDRSPLLPSSAADESSKVVSHVCQQVPSNAPNDASISAPIDDYPTEQSDAQTSTSVKVNDSSVTAVVRAPSPALCSGRIDGEPSLAPITSQPIDEYPVVPCVAPNQPQSSVSTEESPASLTGVTREPFVMATSTETLDATAPIQSEPLMAPSERSNENDPVALSNAPSAGPAEVSSIPNVAEHECPGFIPTEEVPALSSVSQVVPAALLNGSSVQSITQNEPLSPGETPGTIAAASSEHTHDEHTISTDASCRNSTFLARSEPKDGQPRRTARLPTLPTVPEEEDECEESPDVQPKQECTVGDRDGIAKLPKVTKADDKIKGEKSQPKKVAKRLSRRGLGATSMLTMNRRPTRSSSRHESSESELSESEDSNNLRRVTLKRTRQSAADDAVSEMTAECDDAVASNNAPTSTQLDRKRRKTKQVETVEQLESASSRDDSSVGSRQLTRSLAPSSHVADDQPGLISSRPSNRNDNGSDECRSTRRTSRRKATNIGEVDSRGTKRRKNEDDASSSGSIALAGGDETSPPAIETRSSEQLRTSDDSAAASKKPKRKNRDRLDFTDTKQIKENEAGDEPTAGEAYQKMAEEKKKLPASSKRGADAEGRRIRTTRGAIQVKADDSSNEEDVKGHVPVEQVMRSTRSRRTGPTDESAVLTRGKPAKKGDSPNHTEFKESNESEEKSDDRAHEIEAIQKKENVVATQRGRATRASTRKKGTDDESMVSIRAGKDKKDENEGKTSSKFQSEENQGALVETVARGTTETVLNEHEGRSIRALARSKGSEDFDFGLKSGKRGKKEDGANEKETKAENESEGSPGSRSTRVSARLRSSEVTGKASKNTTSKRMHHSDDSPSEKEMKRAKKSDETAPEPRSTRATSRSRPTEEDIVLVAATTRSGRRAKKDDDSSVGSRVSTRSQSSSNRVTRSRTKPT